MAIVLTTVSQMNVPNLIKNVENHVNKDVLKKFENNKPNNLYL